MKSAEDLDQDKHRIKNVGDANDKTDTVVFNQIMAHNYCFWDSRNMQVSRVKDATTCCNEDTFGQFLTSLRAIKVGKTTMFNADNNKISNVSEGVLPTGAAVVKQIPTDVHDLKLCT